MISIVIPTYNHCDDLLIPCVKSIIQYTDLSRIELIISANGCKDNTLNYLEELYNNLSGFGFGDRLKIVWSDESLGYPRAVNEGIKVASGDKIVLLNNDCILLEQRRDMWLDLLLVPFTQDSTCGISCVTKMESVVTHRDFAIFFCAMIDRRVFNQIGFLNEEYGIGSGEDIEFSILAQDAGFTIHKAAESYFNGYFWATYFPIYHLGEGTVHDTGLVSNWSHNYTRNSFKVASKLNKDWISTKISNKYKIGVITPVYNDLSRIFNAVDCVLSQTIDNITHYIYDDCSTDGLCRETVEDVLSKYSVRYYRGDTNQGPSYARNFLIERAIADGCEFIAFLDSDDSWSYQHLQASLDQITDCDIVFSNPYWVNTDNGPVLPIGIPIPRQFIGKQLYHNNYIWISSVLAKAGCFEIAKFNSELDSVEDWDIWFQLYEQGFIFKKKHAITNRYLVKTDGLASYGNSKKHLLFKTRRQLSNLKLNVGSGNEILDDYINIDFNNSRADISADVSKLPYDDDSVDEIRAYHILEHFDFQEVNQVLQEWFRVLKPSGKLVIETPDFLSLCEHFIKANSEEKVVMYNHFFGHHWIPGCGHKFLFTDEQLKTCLTWAGFKKIQPFMTKSKYERVLQIEAYKPYCELNHEVLKNREPNTYREIFELNTYQAQYSEIEGKTVIDIGASVGLFSLFCAERGAKKILAVEAQPTVYNLGLKVYVNEYVNNPKKRYAKPHIVPINLAIWDKDNESLCIPNLHLASKIGPEGEKVTSMTLRGLLDCYQIYNSNMVLKLDCEGAEYPILLSTDTDTLDRFSVVYLELHEHNLYNTPDILRQKLLSAGFRCVHSFRHSTHANDGNTIYLNQWTEKYVR